MIYIFNTVIKWFSTVPITGNWPVSMPVMQVRMSDTRIVMYWPQSDGVKAQNFLCASDKGAKHFYTHTFLMFKNKTLKIAFDSV